MYFDTKSYLKSTRNHTAKHDLTLALIWGNLGKNPLMTGEQNPRRSPGFQLEKNSLLQTCM